MTLNHLPDLLLKELQLFSWGSKRTVNDESFYSLCGIMIRKENTGYGYGKGFAY